MGVLCALALVLSRPRRGGPPLGRACRPGGAGLAARPVELAARALLAEINGDGEGLPAAPTRASSLAESLLLRAHALLGDDTARGNWHMPPGCWSLPGS